MDLLTTLTHLLTVSVLLLVDILRFWALSARSGASLRAENLFLRKQLALYEERKIKPRRANDSTRLVLVLLSRLFDWKGALLFVKPETLIGWHRKGFRLFWRWKGKQRGRPRLPMEIRALIRQMAKENITWGEERIAAELLLKLGIHVSARTVRRYMPHIPGTWEKSEQWTTFIKNHAQGILACDFFVTVTANFRLLYVFVIMEIGTRRIVHINVTDHPTSGWTLQQFREAIQESGAKRFLIHDRDCIYSKDLDAGIGSMGIHHFESAGESANCKRLL